ncbi:hypothetical protein O181_080310 [Austropuccinia psidii MF-1]|uniref:J domain-containing protein n=1 Tax=Austropuccinia psidii MF-1 TaxID=1389203 RepID=A0A9Q3IIR8_9BASI|nr:hypothetical protein [Austropuccinia psidii MF-1]
MLDYFFKSTSSKSSHHQSNPHKSSQSSQILEIAIEIETYFAQFNSSLDSNDILLDLSNQNSSSSNSTTSSSNSLASTNLNNQPSPSVTSSSHQSSKQQKIYSTSSSRPIRYSSCPRSNSTSNHLSSSNLKSKSFNRSASYSSNNYSNHSSISSKKNHHDRLACDLVDQINHQNNLYSILGFKSNLSTHQIKFEDIRKAYITRSRLCHPDKLPNYGPCTAAFQKLSFAYETLSKSSSRRIYDFTLKANHHRSFKSQNHSQFNPSSSSDQFNHNDIHPSYNINADETLNSVLYSTFCEFMDGDFQMIRVLINALNEGNPGFNLGDETINNLETTFKKLRTILLTGQKYLKLVRFELIKLYEIQSNLRSLSYFNLMGRVSLSLALARVTISIPMRIDQAMRGLEDSNIDHDDLNNNNNNNNDQVNEKNQKEPHQSNSNHRQSQDFNQRSGILPPRVAGLLEATVAVLERGERATMWASGKHDDLDRQPISKTSSQFKDSSKPSSKVDSKDVDLNQINLSTKLELGSALSTFQAQPS